MNVNFSEQEWKAAQQQMGNADPEQLKAQAQMLKNMDKDTVRRSNPQFANMSDSEIDMMAGQMEMMASNPAMMKSAMSMMGGMSHTDARAKVKQATAGRTQAPAVFAGGFRKGDRVEIKGLVGAKEHNGKNGTVVGPQGERVKILLDDSDAKTLALKIGNLTKIGSDEVTEITGPNQVDLNTGMALPDTATLEKGMEAMASADPATLRAQAAAMRNMDPATIRSMNPAMANLSDEAIKASADQMEAMADNPSMIAMARQQMASMSPEAMAEQMKMIQNMGPEKQTKLQAAAQKMAASGDMEQMARDMAAGKEPDAEMASKMIEALDGDAVQEMVGAMKENPSMIKEMMKNSPMTKNMTDEQLDAQVAAVQNIDEETIKVWVGRAKKVHAFFKPLIVGCSRLNRVLGGKLLQVVGVAFVALVVRSLVRRFLGGAAPQPGALDALKEAAAEVVTSLGGDDDEFAEAEL